MTALLDEMVASRGDDPAVIEGERTVTWAELDERVARLVHALRDRGVRTGGRVVAMLGNQVELVEVTLACIHGGWQLVPVNWHWVSREVAYVLADASLPRATPEAWAAAALALYHRLAADALVVEVNQGGEMASAVLRQCDPAVPVTPVRATRGKFLRAEPVSLLYAQGRVHHVGAFPALEDELCDFGPDGLSGGGSPDRLDALVWAVTALLLDGGGAPRIRGL